MAAALEQDLDAVQAFALAAMAGGGAGAVAVQAQCDAFLARLGFAAGTLPLDGATVLVQKVISIRHRR